MASPRASGRRSPSPGRISGRTSGTWPGPIHDGYYGNAMFDILDSVESALIHNASQSMRSAPDVRSAPRAASVSGCSSLRSSGDSRCGPVPWHSSDLRWMHCELSDLERRVYETHTGPQLKDRGVCRSDRPQPSRRVPSHAVGPPSPPKLLTGREKGRPAAPLWPRDVGRPSTPPRKSREFDLDDDEPWTGGKKARDSDPPLAHSVDEIDDVLSLLQRSPSYA